MTIGGVLADPASRTLATWWRQLTSWHPRRLWFGHFPIQRLEALVRTGRTVEASELQRMLLSALNVHRQTSVAQLDAVLQLGQSLLGHLLHELHEAGLAHADAGATWQPTSLGMTVLRDTSYNRASYERRTFTFLDARPQLPPRFLNVPEGIHFPDWSEAIDTEHPPLTADVIRECVSQSREWKESLGFPVDVETVLDAIEATGSNGELLQPPWKRVLIVRPERLTVVAIETEAQRLFFAVRGDHSSLGNEPLWSEPLDGVSSSMCVEPTMEVWMSAWRKWCESRNLPANGTREMKREGHFLRIGVSPQLDEFLATHGGEQWLLAEGHPLRPAVQVTWQRENR